MHPKLPIAYFVTSHGFGHAARASAVMNAIHDRWPFVHFEIFTLTPDWFFNHSLKASYTYHSEQTDVGLVQTSPLHFDPDKTIEALERFLPFEPAKLERLADTISDTGCHLVISDISPLGISVAQLAGISSVLVENFTWDWIYAPYVTKDARFGKYIDLISRYVRKADRRIQAAPVCEPVDSDLCTSPISRPPRTESQIVRQKLGINERFKTVLITMGGISSDLPFIDQLKAGDENICFVIPQTDMDVPNSGTRQNNVVFLPQNSAFYHPDLVNAADAVIGKVGYSTLAEVYHAGVPYGFVSRSDFRESAVFESYIRRNMAGIQFTETDFRSGAWLETLPELLALPRRSNNEPNGAESAADYICHYLVCEKEILEIVDPQGIIVGAAPRKCVHGDNRLLHRVVHVLVRDGKNRLLLQKRSLKKRVAPGRWDTSVGGHVDCGESVEKAMYREMEEELGIRPQSLQFAYQYIHSNDFESELVFTYTCRYDKPVVFNPDEIDAVKFWEMKEIEDHLGKNILSDNFEDEFRRYRQWIVKSILE